MFRLSDGEEIMTLAFFVLIQYRSVTDGQTDGHLCSGYTSAGKNDDRLKGTGTALTTGFSN